MKAKQTIGRFEYVAIGDKVFKVPAKIDTGAFRSSIHVTQLSVSKDKVPKLTFTILGHPAEPQTATMQTSKFEKLSVTSSNGQSEDRYEVTLLLTISEQTFNTSFTLSNREHNLFPILIGRKALSRRFVVDTALSGIDRRALKKRSLIKPEYEEYMEDTE